jgi:hypothetical protein
VPPLLRMALAPAATDAEDEPILNYRLVRGRLAEDAGRRGLEAVALHPARIVSERCSPRVSAARFINQAQVAGFRDGSVGSYAWSGDVERFAEALHGASPCRSVCIADDGETIASAGDSGKIHINVLFGGAPNPAPCVSRGSLRALSLHPDFHLGSANARASCDAGFVTRILGRSFAFGADGTWLTLASVAGTASGPESLERVNEARQLWTQPGLPPTDSAEGSEAWLKQSLSGKNGFSHVDRLHRVRSGELRRCVWSPGGRLLAAVFEGQLEVYDFWWDVGVPVEGEDPCRKVYVAFAPSDDECFVAFVSDSEVVWGWGDTVSVVRLEGDAASAKFVCRCSLEGEVVAGVAEFGEHVAVLTASPPTLRILSRAEEMEEVSCDVLPVSDEDGLSLVSDSRRVRSGGLPWLAVCTGRQCIVVTPRNAVDHIRWLKEGGRVLRALQVAQSLQARAGELRGLLGSASDPDEVMTIRQEIATHPQLPEDEYCDLVRGHLVSLGDDVEALSTAMKRFAPLSVGGSSAVALWDEWGRRLLDLPGGCVALASALPLGDGGKGGQLLPSRVYDQCLSKLGENMLVETLHVSVRRWCALGGRVSRPLFTLEAAIETLRRCEAALRAEAELEHADTLRALETRFLSAQLFALAQEWSEAVRLFSSVAMSAAPPLREAAMESCFRLLEVPAVTNHPGHWVRLLARVDPVRLGQAVGRKYARKHPLLRQCLAELASSEGGEESPDVPPWTGGLAAQPATPEGEDLGPVEAAMARMQLLDALWSTSVRSYRRFVEGSLVESGALLRLEHCRLKAWLSPGGLSEMLETRGTGLRDDEAESLLVAVAGALEELDAGTLGEFWRAHGWSRDPGETERDLVRASAGLLVRQGNVDQALDDVLEQLGDVGEAVALVERSENPELWTQLVDKCSASVELMSQLLTCAGQSAGLEVDMVELVDRIPTGVEVPNLGESVLNLARQQEMQVHKTRTARGIIGADLASLFRAFRTQLDRAVLVPWNACDVVSGRRLLGNAASASDRPTGRFEDLDELPFRPRASCRPRDERWMTVADDEDDEAEPTDMAWLSRRVDQALTGTDWVERFGEKCGLVDAKTVLYEEHDEEESAPEPKGSTLRVCFSSEGLRKASQRSRPRGRSRGHSVASSVSNWASSRGRTRAQSRVLDSGLSVSSTSRPTSATGTTLQVYVCAN